MSQNSRKKICKKGSSGPGQVRQTVPVIGLAGGIGSGKTLAASELAQMGCAVIDVDRLAKELRDLPQTRQALGRSLGDQIFAEDGQIDDKALAELVFRSSGQARNDSDLARLNAVVHPLVADKCRELIKQYRRQEALAAVVLDAPLLFEASLDRYCDVIIFIRSDSAVRSGRVQNQRGWNEKQWSQREKAQIILDKKRDMSDYIVDNNSSKIDLRCHIQKLFPRILGTTASVKRKTWPSEALSEH